MTQANIGGRTSFWGLYMRNRCKKKRSNIIWEHLEQHDLTTLPCKRNTLQVVAGLRAEKEKNKITTRSWRM